MDRALCSLGGALVAALVGTLVLGVATAHAAPTTNTTTAAPADPAKALADRERLRVWLQKLAAEAPSPTTAGLKLEPARTLPAQPAARGIEIALWPEQIALESGKRFADPKALRPAVDKLVAQHRELGDKLPTRFVLDIDGATPWPFVVAVLDQLALTPTEVAFHFARPPLARPFPSSPIDAELATIAALRDPVQKSGRLATTMNKVFVRCARSMKAFSGLASTGAGDRTSVFLSLLDRLLGDPACLVEPASVQAVVWAMMGGSGLQSLALRLDRKTPVKDRVMAGFNATWHDVVSAGLLDKAFAAHPARATYLMLAPR